LIWVGTVFTETEGFDPVDDRVQCGAVLEVAPQHGHAVPGRHRALLEGDAEGRTGLTLEGDFVSQ